VPSTWVGLRRSAVRWVWGHSGPFRRTPATTPSPSEPSPSLYLRPLGCCSSGARGATAMQASALEASVNELIDMPSLVAILAQKPPMLCPNGHQPFGTKA
jgi:hypothetical protein